MKKQLFFLIAGVGCFFNLIADIDVQDLGPTDISGLKENDSRGPFKVESYIDVVGDAKLKDCDHHLQFAIAEVELSAVFYHNPCYEEGASVGISYCYNRIDWRRNHLFNQKDFNEACLTLSFSSKRLCSWLWQAQVSANFDNLKCWSFNDYMNYDMTLWGRYAHSKRLGIHIGFIALTGMKIDRVYPIIGVDYEFNQRWKLNLVFPVNLSVIYTFNKSWSASFGGRLFYERHRLDSNEVLSKGLIVYTTAGAELAINYSPKEWFYANIHAGYDFGGRFKTANRNYKFKHNYDIDGAPYAGAELDFAF